MQSVASLWRVGWVGASLWQVRGMLIAQWSGQLRPELVSVLPELTGYDCHDAVLVLFGSQGGCSVIARASLALSRQDRHGYARGIVEMMQHVPDIEGVSLVLYGSPEHEAHEFALIDEIRAEALAAGVHIHDASRVLADA